METVCLQDKKIIESFLRRNTDLHIYSIGDLDDFFWPHTKWYGLKINDEVQAVALLYTGQELPALLALSENIELMQKLLESIFPTLPKQFYSHLSPGLESFFQNKSKIESHGEHYKMALNDKSPIDNINCSNTVRLSNSDLEDILAFYKKSYPDNWFDPRMLETNMYFGLKLKNKLISVAGIHVYSEKYKVAALGNITTHPDHRNKGFGTITTARLCRELIKKVDTVGLNVKADNHYAISCYQKLGFKIIASYGEFMINTK